MASAHPGTSTLQLLEALQEARTCTLGLVGDLTDAQLIGPRLSIINPLRWELGHLAWFQEFWMLRHLGAQRPILSNGDKLYDSARVAHDTRWDLSLLSRSETLSYLQEVLDRVIAQCNQPGSDSRIDANGYDQAYFLHLVLFHEQMHAEAIAYTRQTLSYPGPQFLREAIPTELAQGIELPANDVEVGFGNNDVEIPGGEFLLGNCANASFVFDNEQDAHEVEVAPFAIAKTAVTNGEFTAFVEAGGYSQRQFWSDEGWSWRGNMDATQPVYWKHEDGKWWRQSFDRCVPLEVRLPVIHVNWHEASAFCHWARRRLPTEAEWEVAASAKPTAKGNYAVRDKRRYPWGNEAPTADRANLDWERNGCIAVDALPAGDSAFGCRQMIGNVWEWTASDFLPYPGFRPGPYTEYSQPWFGDHKVLRGGGWATRSSLILNTYRNFYQPDRRDVWAGFRTCAL